MTGAAPPAAGTARPRPTPAGRAAALLGPAAFGLASWGLLWWPIVLGGCVLFHGDISAQQLPLTLHAASYLHAGRIPLWSPDLTTGFPMAAGQAGLWLPTTWLLAAWPSAGPHAYSVLLAGVSLLAWVGMYLFARRLGLSRGASCVAATAFAYAGPLLARDVQPDLAAIMALMPWLGLGAEMMVTAANAAGAMAGVAVFGAAFALQCLAYHPQTIGLAFLPAAAYVILRPSPVGLARRLGLLAAAAALGIGLAAPELLPAAELVAWNGAAEPRGAAYVLRYAPRARQIIGILLPGFWGDSGLWLGGGNYHETSLAVGVVTIGLALLGLRLRADPPAPGAAPAPRFPRALLIGTALVAATISLPTVTKVHLVLGHLPFLGASRALSRCWFIAGWALAAPAGGGPTGF